MDLLLSADIAEELGCHGIRGAGGLGVAREMQGVANTNQPQYVVGVLLQCFIFAHQVVVDVTRVAKLVNGLPVLVEWAIALRGWIHQVLSKLLEFNIGTVEQGVLCGVFAVAPHNTGAEALVEGRVVLEGELVAVRGDQPLEWLTNKEELEVVLEAVVDLGNAVLVQRLKVGGNMSFIGRDFHWVTVGKRHQHNETKHTYTFTCFCHHEYQNKRSANI